MIDEVFGYFMLGVGQILGGCLQLEHASQNGANKQGVTREISIDELKERDGIQYLEEWERLTLLPAQRLTT